MFTGLSRPCFVVTALAGYPPITGLESGLEAYVTVK